MDTLANGNSCAHEEPSRESGAEEISPPFQEEVRSQLQEVLRRLDGLAQKISGGSQCERQPPTPTRKANARIYDPELDTPEARQLWRAAPSLEEEETKVGQAAQATPKGGSRRRASVGVLRPPPSGVPERPVAGSDCPSMDFSLPNAGCTAEARPPDEGAGHWCHVQGKAEQEEQEDKEEEEEEEDEEVGEGGEEEWAKKEWIKRFYISQNTVEKSSLAVWAGDVMRKTTGTTATCPVDATQQQVGLTRLWHFVHSPLFDTLSCITILLNVVMIGVAADAQLKTALLRTPESSTWDHIEITFCVLFSLELVLRVIADRATFVFGPESRWNIFDAVLVILSVTDAILNALLSNTNSTVSNVTIARILRFVRLVRITRVVRAVRAFHNLRIIVFAIFEAMSSLIWCLLVVGLIIYVFAILFLYGVTEHFADASSVDNDLNETLLNLYGNVPLAIVTLFGTISGGVDWMEAMNPLHRIHWTYMPLFTLFIFLMEIGVLNVVMGAFVAATADMVAKDKEAMVKAEISALQSYTQKIKSFFHDADKDKSGMLSWGEFEQHLQVPKVSAYFRTLELDVSQAHALFKLLDKDGSNEVSLDEFLAGCMRLKGVAKSLEVNMLLYESRRLFAKVTDFVEAMEATRPGVSPRLQERRRTRTASCKSTQRLAPSAPAPPAARPPSLGVAWQEQVQEDAAAHALRKEANCLD